MTSDTRPEDMEKCSLCGALVDPAVLSEVWIHFVDGSCVVAGEAPESITGIRGEKVSEDA